MTIEIIGYSCVAPSAGNTEELFGLLRDGRCSVSEIPHERWDKARFWHPVRPAPGKAYTFAAGVLDRVHDFDPALFGLSAREASYMDPQQRILLQLVWRALEDASIPTESLQDERTGVYIGASSSDNGNLFVEDPASGSPYFMTGNTLSIVSNRISHIFGLSGPSMTVDTACSSSLVALDQAVRALGQGEIDTAIVGGINLLLHPFSFSGFSQARMLSPEGLCRAYGENGQGYVRAEGGGVVILRRSDRCAREGDRSRARIVATGVNSAGRTNGISLPSREAQARLLQSIYQERGIDPDDLAFIEGHGTGTKVGDPAEAWAIGTVLGQARKERLPLGSVKSNIGHAEPASGMLGLIKAVMALENDFLPASLHAEVLNQDIDFDGLNIDVNRTGKALARGATPRLAGINSFGFGGTNVHVVISDPAPECPRPAAADDPVFVASAHTRTALENLLGSYEAGFGDAEDGDGRLLIEASTSNRTLLRHRFAVASKEPEEVLTAIRAHLSGTAGGIGAVGEAPGRDVRIAFAFSGNGAQWAGMGTDAYLGNAGFRRRFDDFASLFSDLIGENLSELLFSDELAERLKDTKIAQPMLFAVQAALSDCLVERGIRPHAVFGHSVGELAAAYAAGILSAQDAVTVVALRSRHQDDLAGEGTMAAAILTESKAVGFARKHNLASLCVAAVNAHNSVTVSGSVDDIAAFREKGRKADIPVHILDINYPFHHPVIDRVRGAFLAEIPAFTPGSGHVPFVSTVTGKHIEGKTLDAGYWWSNVREPVLFRSGTEAALELGCNLFIEISPRSILSGYMAETIRQATASATVIPTLARPGREAGGDPVSEIVARAVAHGARPWEVSGHSKRLPGVRLPPLPFENEPYRPQATSDALNLFGRDGNGQPYSLLGWRTDPVASTWKNHLDAHLLPDLAGHVVDGKAIMPGSGYIEIAAQAARRFYGSDDLEITNLEIFRPLELRDNRIAELSTVISPETGTIEIRSREYLSEDGWTVHATGRSRKAVTAMGTRKIPSAAEKSGEISGTGAYEIARQFGLDYAENFRLLEKAEVYGDRHVLVTLRDAAEAGHPYMSYGLHPVSVDAAFHGLVAMFGRFTGENGGAPYIPVRFGMIRIGGSGQRIAKAVIAIQRVSNNSIKARFDLLDASGAVVASLDDCRFRRTYLRQHHTLETISYHYETIDALQPRPARSSLPDIAALLPSFADVPPGEATLYLGAAVHGACHQIAMALSGGSGRVSLDELPGDFAFRCFLAHCLYTLEDAGLAVFEAQGWTIRPESGLPAVDELLLEVYRKYPGRSAEAVLVNNTRLEVLERLAAGSEAVAPAFISEATLDQVENHTAPGRARAEAVLQSARLALEALAAGQPATVMEAGALSVEFSARLADLVALRGGRLFILEPEDNLRRTLEIAFEKNPAVNVLPVDAPLPQTAIDLTVSASATLFSRLGAAGPLRTAVAAQVANGGRFVAMQQPSSIVSDFVFGLTDDWFAQSTSPEFPVGQLASPGQWEQLLKDIGFSEYGVVAKTLADGGLLAIAARAHPAPDHTKQDPVFDGPVLHAVADGAVPPVVPGAVNRSVSRDPKTGLPRIDEDIEPVSVVFTAAGTVEPGDASGVLQRSILELGALAEAIRNNHATADNPRNPALVIVAPGGAPAQASIEPVNSGIWTFARVLQNEYDEIDIYLVDARADEATTGATIAMLLSANHSEREWIRDRETGLLSYVRAVPGPAGSLNASTEAFGAAVIRQRASSRIDSIVWEECAVPAPAPGEITVAVAATGLNFRDVMWAMGLLPEEALEDGFAGATIGMEMAGTVSAVGEGVTDIAPGDLVMGIGPAAFSTHMTVSRAGVTRIPGSIDPVAAATVPVAFLTAYYAMIELGRIQAGDTILIHGAAGGVGLAALQIARLKGATVFATAGTTEKRRFLRMLGADHVFDSRRLDFVDAIRGLTGGQGVDIVLNSLFAEAMERSFELLKPFGRFLELGKRDYYSDRKIGLRPFRRNISYFGIDADQLLVNEPELTKRIFTEIGALFAAGKLTPLPHRVFRHDEIASAFRLMQNAGQIGKIVVRPPAAGSDRVATVVRDRYVLSPGVYLVAGGIGGFGLAAAEWLASRGATHLALCSRGGKADEATLAAITALKARGVETGIYACDITDEDAVRSLLDELRRKGPLKGVVHAAMVLDDGLIASFEADRNRPVIDVKVKGAGILDRLTRTDDLDLFLLFSSATTLVGNPGQGNYVAANGYLEGLARARRSSGLPALAVGFGAIADTGFLARNSEVNEILSKRIGKTALRARDALAFVERYLAGGGDTVEEAVVMIAELDWAAASGLTISGYPLFSAIPRHHAMGQSGGDGEQLDIPALIAGKSADEARTILHGILAGEIAAILKVSEDSVTPARVLKDIGLDSLMAMELSIGFQQKTGMDIPLGGIGQGATVGEVVQKLYEKILLRGRGDDNDGSSAGNLVQDLAEKHVGLQQQGRPAENG